MKDLNLNSLRKELDIIDDSILELLSKRFDVTLNIGEFKKENNIEIFQPNREKELLKAKSDIGAEFGLDEKFISKFYQMIMDESKIKQKEFLSLDK